MDNWDTDGQPALIARLLGRSELALGKRVIPADAWPGRAARSLLLLLLGTPGHRLPRDRVLDALWPEASPAAALNSLYKAIHALRRVLEPTLRDAKRSAYVQIGQDALWIVPRPKTWVDVDIFEESVACAAFGSSPDRRATLRAALAEYRGDFLADEPYADWPIPRREALRGLRERAALDLAALDLEAGDPLLPVPELESLLSTDPTNEEARRALMRAFAAAGQRDRALRQFDRCIDVLMEDLGVEPAPETLALRDAIVAMPSPAIPSPPVTSAPPVDNLPAPLTPLVGREREVNDLQALLSRPDVRLVTLTGPGGIGKTRLAVAVAAGLTDEFAHGVAFVSLASLQDPNLVLPTVARTLSIREDHGRSIEATLRANLAARAMLLVLDNFEQVMPAAPAISDLLAAGHDLKILVTSREPLRLRGEHDREVAPLSLPNPERLPSPQALARYGAVALLRRSIQTVRPAFEINEANLETVAGICLRLDGLPLAIELAAARCRRLTPEAMLVRLGRPLDVLTGGPRDAPARQRTLRDAIAWSYDLLDEEERGIFRRLAVFPGGFPVEEATSSPFSTVPDLFTSLADKSLVVWDTIDDEARVRMLETIREFAIERLILAEEEEAARQAQVAWCLSLVEKLRDDLFGPAQTAALDRIDREIDNLRAAMDWSISRNESSLVLRLAGAFWRFWLVRGRFSEGRDWLERALALAREGDPTVDALLGASRLATEQGDHAAATRLGSAGLAVARSLDDPKHITSALIGLTISARNQGRLDDAISLTDEALVIHRATGNEWGVADCLMVQGQIAWLRNELDQAGSLFAESLIVFRRLGDPRAVSSAVLNIAIVVFSKCQFTRAVELYEEGLAIARQLDDRPRIAITLANLASALRFTGEFARGVELATQALHLAETTGDTHVAGVACYVLGDLQLANPDLDDERSALSLLRQGAILLHQVDDRLELIRCLEVIVGAVVLRRRPEDAARLLSATAQQRALIDSPVQPWEAPAIAAYEYDLVDALGDEIFRATQQSGQTMSIDEIFAEVVALMDAIVLE